jgi:pilus assembly protein CpaE
MRAIVLSDAEALGAQAQQILLRTGCECPTAQPVLLAGGEIQVAKWNPNLVVVVLSPDPARGMKTVTGLRGHGESRVIAIGPAFDPQLILDAIRHGASDYVDECDVEVELEKALRRLQNELGSNKEAGKVIAVLAPNGGSGSSTLAVNLATALAKNHKQALLIDLKLESGDLAALLDVKPAHTLADLCGKVANLDRVMFERSLAHHTCGVMLLAPSRHIRDVAGITTEGIKQAITLGRGIYPYVVMDLDHSFRPEQLEALRQVDVLLLVMRLEFASLRNCRRTLEHLRDLDIRPEQIRLVANRYGQPKELPAAKVEEALEMKIDHYLPEDAKYINRANNNGVPVVLETPSSRYARSLTQLAVALNGKPTTR